MTDGGKQPVSGTKSAAAISMATGNDENQVDCVILVMSCVVFWYITKVINQIWTVCSSSSSSSTTTTTTMSCRVELRLWVGVELCVRDESGCCSACLLTAGDLAFEPLLTWPWGMTQVGRRLAAERTDRLSYYWLKHIVTFSHFLLLSLISVDISEDSFLRRDHTTVLHAQRLQPTLTAR